MIFDFIIINYLQHLKDKNLYFCLQIFAKIWILI